MKKIIVLGIAILVCASLASATVGYFAGQYNSKKSFYRKWHENGDKGERFKQRMMARLDKKLGLDEQQKEIISGIIDAKQEKFGAAKKEFRDQIRQIKETTEADIRGCLRPDQQEKYDRMLEEHKARMEKMRGKYSRRKFSGRKYFSRKGGGRCAL